MKTWKKENRDKNLRHKKDWYKRHAEHIKAQRKKRYEENREEIKRKQREYQARVETKDMESWLKKCLKHAKSSDKKYKRGFNLSIDFLLDLYDKQGGKCALSGAHMTHQRDDTLAASIDRISPAKGHTRDNVQIICSGLNRAKREYNNEHMEHFLKTITESFRKKRQKEGLFKK
jgi:hypothetical protein